MVIPDNKIYNTAITREYSVNNKTSWTDCGGGIVSHTFAVGEKVWVREKANTSVEWYLGQVNYLSGYADLFPSSRIALTYYDTTYSYWAESDSFVPGQNIIIYFKYANIGMAQANQSFTIKFYLSSDKVITSADTLLCSLTNAWALSTGTIPASDNSYYVSSDPNSSTSPYTIPSLSAGTYYLGYILDSGSNLTELNDDNNTTPADMVREVVIKDTTANSGGGAFKLVNSWGVGGSWEHIHDGHYWLTYPTMKALQMAVFYYSNDVTVRYQPTVIAVFKLTHPARNACLVKVGLGNPSSPYMVKEFQARSGTYIFSGALPFPNNNMALDVSEFATAVNNMNLFLSVTTASGAAAGTVDAFQVRYYYNTTGGLITTVSGGTGAFAGNNTTTTFTATTTNALSSVYLGYIMPQTRAAAGGCTFVEDAPAGSELAADMSLVGVYVPGRNYNKIAYGHGTGFAPPSYDEWMAMRKLRAVQSNSLRATGANAKLDHSTEIYFPPIGNQGTKGSCTCFAVGYYTHTYMTAKEFNWDLSGLTWVGTNPGAPSGTTTVMSPDFIYNQINDGGDNGSSAEVAFALLCRMGGATWAQMPYNQGDSTSWPSEAAFLDAAKYRGRDVMKLDGYLNYGYFMIRDDSDINLLKQLLLNGYIVTTAIQAGNPGGLYTYFDTNDVVNQSSMPVPSIDHAQTIVGFKDGTSWHIATPDD